MSCIEAQVEQVPGDGEEDGQDDVGDRRQEVGAELAANQAQGRSHSMTPLAALATLSARRRCAAISRSCERRRPRQRASAYALSRPVICTNRSSRVGVRDAARAPASRARSARRHRLGVSHRGVGAGSAQPDAVVGAARSTSCTPGRRCTGVVVDRAVEHRDHAGAVLARSLQLRQRAPTRRPGPGG